MNMPPLQQCDQCSQMVPYRFYHHSMSLCHPCYVNDLRAEQNMRQGLAMIRGYIKHDEPLTIHAMQTEAF